MGNKSVDIKVILSVVILNYNSIDLMKRCIKQLCNIAPIDTEVIVIDNGSNDGSAEWLHSQSDYYVHSIYLASNVGFAAGCNEGIKKSTGEYVLLLNTDAFPELGSLDILVGYLKKHPEVGIVGPQLLYPDHRWQHSSARLLNTNSAIMAAFGITILEKILSIIFWRYFGNWWNPRSVDTVVGASILLRRTMIDKIGLLDTRFFFYVEDVEYCYRARKNGWDVRLIPASHVTHLCGGSSIRTEPIKTMKFLCTAEREFILGEFGLNAWKKYRFWMIINYSWRAIVARVLGDIERFQLYKESKKIYSSISIITPSPRDNNNIFINR